MSRVYREYQRDRVGWFLGLNGTQLGTLAGGLLPVTFAVHQGRWAYAAVCLAGWFALLVLVVVPVRGRSVAGWAAASLRFAIARATGATRTSSRAATGMAGTINHNAGVGDAAPLVRPDLPVPLHLTSVHTTRATMGSPGNGRMVAVVQDRATGSWAVTARIEHSGLGWLADDDRDRWGSGLAAVLDAACRTDVISEVLIMVRVAPDPGGDRRAWLDAHRDPTANPLAQRVHEELRNHLTPAAVRSETFLTIVAPDRRLRRLSRRSIRRTGPAGAGALPNASDDMGRRATVLFAVVRELGQLAGDQLGLDRITWLDSEGLASACRTGYHPDHVDPPAPPWNGARAFRADGPASSGEVSWPAGCEPDSAQLWAVAGPSRARSCAGWYVHDRWLSCSTSVVLPARGAVLGALAPVLAGGRAGERRSLVVAFPVMPVGVADRATASREWAADLGDGLRARAGVRARARTRADNSTARGVDAKLLGGAALCRPYAVATTTIPVAPPGSSARHLSDDLSADPTTRLTASSSVDGGGELILASARRLEADLRRAGYAAQRLDLAHDTAFGVGCVPLGRTIRSRGGHT